MSPLIMRILIVFVLIISVGTILIFRSASYDRSLNSAELAQLKTNCLKCHGAPPVYPNVTFVHHRHAVLACSVCHNRETGISASESANSIVRWVSAGILAFSLVGILANLMVMKTKKREQ